MSEDADAVRPAGQLDDVADRAELRDRYEVLLQELRVVLPGVQVLLAFLLTAPFASGFERLDSFGRDLFAVALTSALGAVVLLMCPAVFHRVGRRTARVRRLVWGIRTAVAGLVLLSVALVSAVWCVSRFALGTGPANWIPVVAATLFVGLWAVLPVALLRGSTPVRGTEGSRGAPRGTTVPRGAPSHEEEYL